MNKISVLIWCLTRQEMLNITLPRWLKQEGVDYEIILGHGKDIKWQPHPLIKPVLTDYDPTVNLKMCASYNAMLRAATGNILLYTQADMEVNSPTQLKRMLDLWSPGVMVQEKFFKNNKRDAGIYMQFLMVEKSAVEKIGGMCELYDSPDIVSHSDGDFMACLLKEGLTFKWLETGEADGGGVYHIPHEVMDTKDPETARKIAIGFALHKSRHPEGGIMELFCRQLLGASQRTYGR
jgi:hypothetical protein